jgi:transposase InsO family protein
MANESTGRHDAWARLRFSIVGRLFSAPPERRALHAEMVRLSKERWCHPITGEWVCFGVSTIERWYYEALNAGQDPVGALRRKVRKDAGQQPSLTLAVRQALRAQYRDYSGWSYQLHADNLAALVREHPNLGPARSYATVRRYLKAQGLFPKRRARTQTPGAEEARRRLERLEVRSFEAEYVHGLWHLDYHHGSLRVLSRSGNWETPRLLGVLDDRSRLACHVQWYLEETAETLVHGLSQAIQKRGLPRALMTDNGSPMIAAETIQGLHDLGIVHEPTLPESPYQNAKQEVFWAQVEGRLLAMLRRHPNLTLEFLNEVTQAWVEREYHREVHSELATSPLRRYLDGPTVGRESPSSEALRRAFRAQARRTQRRSDGTLSLEAQRFEVPSRFRHLERLTLRYARWDLRSVDLVDERTGAILASLLPLDKTRNADGHRRSLEPISSEAPAEEGTPPPSATLPPLLRQLLRDYAATGLPPAYIPLRKDPDNNPHHQEK